MTYSPLNLVSSRTYIYIYFLPVVILLFQPLSGRFHEKNNVDRFTRVILARFTFSFRSFFLDHLFTYPFTILSSVTLSVFVSSEKVRGAIFIQMHAYTVLSCFDAHLSEPKKEKQTFYYYYLFFFVSCLVFVYAFII